MTPDNYRIQGNPLAIIGNLENDELGSIIIRRHNELFAGRKDIAFSEPFQRGQPVPASNLPRALSICELLREETKGRIRLLSPEDVVIYWHQIPDKDTTYADTNSIFINPEKKLKDPLYQRALDLIGPLDGPVFASGLAIVPDDNHYGFTFEATSHLKTIRADFLSKKEDAVVTFDPERGLQGGLLGDKGLKLWKGQASFGRLCRGWTMGLYAGFYSPLHADDSGRFQLFQICF